ncbi:MAG TPA: signal peptide peptidase SppA [Flavobacteriales bacterium]|nr:signal peptide peptidase SppA [Flavobacteriales bacterium]HRJ37700.1 signal peptide peptidase SppA [Flavobacteriales bacterium]
MKQFFKIMAASALGQLITGLILAFMFAVFLVGRLTAAFGDQEESNKKVIEDNSILHLKLDQAITDQQSNPSFDFGLGGLNTDSKTGLNRILTSLERAAKDEKIKGVFLDVSMIPAGMATVEEIRNGLKKFKESGKFILAYSEIYTHKSYYLASVADEIHLYPQGIVQHTGLTAEIMFMKGLIEKLELDLTIIRGSNNQFKSAVEPYMLDKMSDANRKQTEKYLFSLWNHMLEGISQERKIEVSKLNQLADSLVLQTSDAALEERFIDRISYRDEIYAELRKRLSIEEKDELNLVSLGTYAKDKRLNKTRSEKNSEKNKAKVAVIYAVGDIIDGKGDDNSIGSVNLSEDIRAARLDTTVKAIVLRVNSPGGSALASDVIWREVVLAGKVKPFVVSMGDVAASGGYYISCAAHKIFAQPNTITGSIGVFGVLPNTERMLKSKLGVTYDRVKTNRYSDIGSMSRAMDEMEYQIIQKGVDDIYADFINKVAEGRQSAGLTPAKVDSIGQGRVWAGTDALAIGLVDELGGLETAISDAAKRANLTEGEYILAEYPIVKDPIEELVNRLKNEAKVELINANFALSPEMMLYLYNVKEILRRKGVAALLPYHLEIH